MCNINIFLVSFLSIIRDCILSYCFQGLTDVEDKAPFLFGEFMYDNTGPPLQYFDVQVEYPIYDRS